MPPSNGNVPGLTPDPSDQLESWKEIAAYLGKGVTTVRRWEREEGLPVRRQEHIKRGSVIAFKSELDEWRRKRISTAEATTSRWGLPAIILLTVLLIGILIAGVGWSNSRGWNPHAELLQLTAYPGDEKSASFAPGGERFAYTSNGVVYVKEFGVEPPRELYRDQSERIYSVKWSPDGSQLAVSHSTTTFDWRVSLIDKTGRKLRQLGPGGPGVTWRRDGKALLVAHRPPGEATSAIYEYDLDTSHMRQVSFPPTGSWGDIAVSVDETGSRLALARYSRISRGDVYLAKYAGREAVKITDVNNWIAGVDWLPLSQGILFDGIVNGRYGIYRVPADKSATPTLIPGTEGVNRNPQAVATGPYSMRIGFAHENWNTNLFMRGGRSGITTPIAVSTQSEEHPDISVDGQLAFVSARTGAENVWVCPPGCEEARQVTKFRERQFELTPRWSPNGRQLALSVMSNRQTQLMVLDAQGENPRVLSRNSGEARPSWSNDGRFLYFQSDRSGRPEIWRIPTSGGAPATQITLNGGVEAFESSSGEEVFFIRTNETATLYRKTLPGSAEAPVKGLPGLKLGNWRPAGNTILYWDEATYSGAKLYELDLSTGRTRFILAQATVGPIHGLSANKNGDMVWSERGRVHTDLQAVDLTFPPFWKRF